ncbi:hypothetical protein BpHYR1_011009 [Brachionus plicatilis]|uniref:Uncharacterized protein n=1 Tax=Brachionus plicatilis TaxID=10195 RepID=A0A3M7PQS4_BRAPC|nr:hypothetical protein BpHYR1_011009 [Brachionus plicatilis]
MYPFLRSLFYIELLYFQFTSPNKDINKKKLLFEFKGIPNFVSIKNKIMIKLLYELEDKS